MVVLTERVFRFSLFISQLLAKAIPVRGAKFKKPAFEQAFCFSTFPSPTLFIFNGFTHRDHRGTQLRYRYRA